MTESEFNAIQLEAQDLMNDLMLDHPIDGALYQACMLVVKGRVEIQRLSQLVATLKGCK